MSRIVDFIHAMTTGDAAKRVIARAIMLGEAQHDREVRELFETQRGAFVGYTQWIVASLDSEDPQADAETLVVNVTQQVSAEALEAELAEAEAEAGIENDQAEVETAGDGDGDASAEAPGPDGAEASDES